MVGGNNKKLKWFTLIFVAGLLLSSLKSYGEPSTCSDLLVVFARGSGQNNGKIISDGVYANSGLRDDEKQSKVFFDEIDKRTNNLNTEYVSLHDFGGRYNQYGYAAVGVWDGFTHKPNHRKDVANRYYESVTDGAEELAWYLEDKLTSCPFQQVILGGYSQGAHVVGDALPKIQPMLRARINYVALYGDPKFNPRTSAIPIRTGSWVRGNAARTQTGALLARKDYLPTGIAVATSWCDINDPVCANYSIGKNSISQNLYSIFGDKTHQEAYQNKWIPQSANEIVNSLRKNNQILANNIQTTTWVNKNDKLYQADLAIVLDVSGSMINTINNIQKKLDSFTASLFNSYWDTRIALIGFSDNDTNSPYIAKKLT
ncbi:MAG: cutinase family protein, partial [Prolixibacteraceae bacterium]|nr:cutinase family protein [Prolixibacteraceae bacterium]